MSDKKYAVREELDGRWSVHRVMDYDAISLWDEIGWYRKECDALTRIDSEKQKDADEKALREAEDKRRYYFV